MRHEAWITLALFASIAGSIATISSMPQSGATISSAAQTGIASVQPELASQPVIHLKEGAIKLSFLKGDTTAIPDMGSASAVRVGCGVAIDFPTQSYKPTIIQVPATATAAKPVVVESTQLRVIAAPRLKTTTLPTTSSRAVVGRDRNGNTRLLVRPSIRPAVAHPPLIIGAP